MSETAPSAAAPRRSVYDVEARRADFPILSLRVRGQPLAYLDNAASSQKPRQVIEAVADYYRREHSNVHRGVHYLAERATAAYEGARRTAARFLGATDPSEVIFVRGTTEALNLVAASFAAPRLAPGDEVLITHLEHHSNIVPWQLACQARGARLVVAPIDPRGDLILEELEARLNDRTRVVAVSHVSNALGTINPVAEIVARAKATGAAVVVDGAQAAPHLALDVTRLGCDFYAFSGHKVYGPTGIGVLWGRRELLEQMPPWQGGGEMIQRVTFEETTFAAPPARFEAGTPHVAGAVGLAAALEYVQSVGLEAIGAHEAELLAYTAERLAELPYVRRIGTARHAAAVVSFLVDGIHAHDVGQVLDAGGVAVRAGHHCAQPLMDFFGVAATARASFGLYNTKAEVEALVAGIEKAHQLFG